MSRKLVSIVINTDGRANALRNTIESLRLLDYSPFEVVVVCGPTPDGTREVGRNFAGKGWIKYLECPERNLSCSRNLGIKHASGEVIAFIDDDAIPEPEWLAELIPSFHDSETGAAGGLVYDPTGYNFQYLYAACDRLGNATLDLREPCDEYNYPFSLRFPYVQGTNGAYRRATLVSMGGFDEEYEFYLDETDVCCRVVDAGLKVRQLANAAVHHKFLPSHVRNEQRITVNKYPIIKNKIYFSLVNNHGHFPVSKIIDDALHFIRLQRTDLEFHVNGGRLRPIDLEAFEEDAERALEAGLTRGLSRQRRTRPVEFFGEGDAFVVFPRLVTDGPRKTFVFLSQSYPPEHSGGNARHTHDIARAIAAFGHTTHVLTKGTDFNRVDLEEGVWVHRIAPKTQVRVDLPDGTVIPEHIWNYAATQLEELYRISDKRQIDAIEAVSWDCEAIATVLDGRFPSATNIVTALSHWLETHAAQRTDSGYMKSFGDPMLGVERHLFQTSPGIVAASRAIAESIQDCYHVELDPERVCYIPHGMMDMALLPRQKPAALAKTPDAVAGKRPQVVLFVGRLELRKGIDVLLNAAPGLLHQFPQVEFWIAGDDTLEIEPGLTARRRFESNASTAALDERVRFLGRVDEEELRWLYANCDVFVSPSRFESFGLIFVEAMMFAKPCIGCRAGGMPEVIADEQTGLLVEPGDSVGLSRAIARLLVDRGLGEQMGLQGRKKFEREFEASVVARQRVKFLSRLSRTPVPFDRMELTGNDKPVEVGFGQKARFLEDNSELKFKASGAQVFITFWRHDWSGIAKITVDGEQVADVDLYSERPRFETVSIVCHFGSRIAIHRTGRKNTLANSSEVIVAAVTHAESGEMSRERKTH
jgi:glycogen(starch) synthase